MEDNALHDFAVKPEIKILVVDDRDDNLFSIEAILEKDKYTIFKANSGRAALKILLQEQDFSLILMDVQMPELSGFETAAIIYERDKLKDIPIMFITAHDYDEEFIFKGYKTGGVDYIYKPINPDLLRVKVAVFVELYRKNQQLLQHEKRLLAANYSLQKEIEEHKRSEEKIIQLNKRLIRNNAELKAMNEELDRFAYVASHDLQEPLRKIMVFIDKILMKNNQDEETEKYFKKIVHSSERMQSLINNILDFSRHAHLPEEFRKTDLNILMQEAISELEIEIENNNAQIQVDRLPAAYVIPGMIRQLFYNLLSNAIKFRRKDQEPIVHVKLVNGETSSDSSFYNIIFADNGIGFDPKHSDEIFQVFKRLHSYHEFEGTGIGLSICKKIVDRHHGLIRADSVPGIGSSFHVSIPRQLKNSREWASN